MPFNCSVCFEALDETIQPGQAPVVAAAEPEIGLQESILVLIPCGHVVHRTCIFSWCSRSAMKSKCPKCGKKVDLNKLLPVFPDVVGVNEDDFDVEEDIPSKNVKTSKAKKNLKAREIYKPVPPIPRDIPEVNCNNEDCEDYLAFHATLVFDFNQLLKQYLAQEQAISKEIRVSEKIQQETSGIRHRVDNLQKERISTFLKRPACTCTQEDASDEDDDDEIDTEMIPDDEAEEALRIQAVMEAEDEEFRNQE